MATTTTTKVYLGGSCFLSLFVPEEGRCPGLHNEIQLQYPLTLNLVFLLYSHAFIGSLPANFFFSSELSFSLSLSLSLSLSDVLYLPPSTLQVSRSPFSDATSDATSAASLHRQQTKPFTSPVEDRSSSPAAATKAALAAQRPPRQTTDPHQAKRRHGEHHDFKFRHLPGGGEMARCEGGDFDEWLDGGWGWSRYRS